MIWQLAVGLTGAMSGLSQVVGKRQVERMGSFQSGVLRDVTTLVMVIIVAAYQGWFQWQWQGIVIFAVGLMESFSIAAYFAATRQHMSATAVFSYPFSQLLIILLAGIFFQEWKYFDVRHLQGIFNVVALALTIILMWVYQSKNISRRDLFKGWSGTLMLSAIVVAISNIQSKWAVTNLGYTPAVSMVYEFLGIVAGGLFYVGYKKQGMRVGMENIAWGVLQGLLFGGSALWYIGLLRDAPLGVASILRRVIIVLVTVGAGMWGYGEGKRMEKRQIISIVLGLLVFGLVMFVNR